MAKVAIVTDSNSGITQKASKELGVTVLPMPFMINEETFFEFCTEISTLIDSLNLPIYDKSILSKKYNDQIKSLYEYLAPIWNAKKIEDKYQLSLF